MRAAPQYPRSGAARRLGDRRLGDGGLVTGGLVTGVVVTGRFVAGVVTCVVAGGLVIHGVVTRGQVNFTTNALEPVGLALAVCEVRARTIPGMPTMSRITNVSDARFLAFRDDAMRRPRPVDLRRPANERR
jgi:hypothetical protein